MNAPVDQKDMALTEPQSNVLDPQVIPETSGGGKPDVHEPVESFLESELNRLRSQDTGEDGEEDREDSADKAKSEPDKKAGDKDDDEEEGTDPKAKPETKDKDAAENRKERPRGDDGKFARTKGGEAAEEEGTEAPVEDEQSAAREERLTEKRKSSAAPARFLPAEKEQWDNVPKVVRSAVDRIIREHETETVQLRQSHENWQSIARFDDMAKQHNTTVAGALDYYTRLDHLLSSNPAEAIRQILATRGITPEQYAEHVTNNPAAHRAPPAPAAPDPEMQRVTGEVVHLRQQMEAMQQEQTMDRIIEPFRSSHPRFGELQDDIEFFLKSGKIPASLAPVERLEAAYDMAERINPRSVSGSSGATALAATGTRQHVNPDAGKKSVRGALNGGDPTDPEDADLEISTLLRKEMRKMRA